MFLRYEFVIIMSILLTIIFLKGIITSAMSCNLTEII